MIAFKTFGQCPEDQRPPNIPIEWPWQEQPCTPEEAAGFTARGFTVMTEAAYYDYKNANLPAYNAWYTASDTIKARDYQKYLSRAAVKDKIIAQMAAENMQRVRTGIWTVADLISLTQDEQLKSLLDDINTLSFELAIGKVNAATHPLLTAEVKFSWVTKLQANLFN